MQGALFPIGQYPHGRYELVRFEGLADIRIRTQLALRRLRPAGRAHEHRPLVPILSGAPVKRLSVHHRHQEVQNDYIRPFPTQACKTLGPSQSSSNGEALYSQQQRDKPHERRVVVHHEDSYGAGHIHSKACRWRGCGTGT